MNIGFINHEKDTKLCAKSVDMTWANLYREKNSVRLY